MPPSPPDQTLLDQARNGDRPALGELISRYANLPYGIALRRTRDPQLAADVAQAVFLVFLRRVNTIAHARSLPAWLMKTTHFALRDAWRAQRRREHHEKRAARPEQAMTSTNQSTEQVWILDDAIDRLSKNDRDVIALRFLQGREIDAIAQTLGIAPEAARKRVARAVERLRELVTANDSTLSAEALLASAASTPIPSSVLKSCTAIATATSAASTGVVSIAEGVLKTFALHKLIAVGTGFVALLAIISIGAALSLSSQTQRTVAAPPATLSAADRQQASDLAELSRLYALSPGEDIRVFPPPFPPVRDRWVDAEFPFANGAKNVPCICFRSTAIGLRWRVQSYSDEDLPGLLDTGLVIPWWHFKGIDKINMRPVHGDIVWRDVMTLQQTMNAIATLITLQTGKPTQAVKTTQTSLSIVLHGDIHPRVHNRAGQPCLVFSQQPLADAALRRMITRKLPDGWSMDDFVPATKRLGAPFFIDDHEGDVPEAIVFVAPDAKLDSTDPQYTNKLRFILNNLQSEMGGEWRVEPRQIEVYTFRVASN